MQLISVRIITSDVPRLVAFYEHVIGGTAVWGNELFAEVATPLATVAIGSERTVPLFGAGVAEPGANRSVIIELIVDDVDDEFTRLAPLLAEQGLDVVQPPTTMPWGNRSLLVRDPDGNLVNLFTPVGEQASVKFGV